METNNEWAMFRQNAQVHALAHPCDLGLPFLSISPHYASRNIHPWLALASVQTDQTSTVGYCRVIIHQRRESYSPNVKTMVCVVHATAASIETTINTQQNTIHPGR